MKKQKLIIIIDPWKRSLIGKLLLWGDDHFLLHRKIKKFIKANEDSIHTIVIAAYENKPVAECILNLPGNKIETTNLQDLMEIIKVYNIKQIYFFGSAWDICVRERELGYLNLYNILKHKNIEILVKDDCVLYSRKSRNKIFYKDKIFNPDDNPNWSITEEPGVFKFNGE